MGGDSAWALRNTIFGGLVSGQWPSLCVRWRPSDRLFLLYHTSMEPQFDAKKDNAIGREEIWRGRSVTPYLVDW